MTLNGSLVAIVAGSALVASAATQPDPGVLTRIHAFAERYQREAPSLVVEERYLQTVTYRERGTSGSDVNQLVRPLPAKPHHREMTSELVMVRLPGTAGWVLLRDVLEVDKRRIRDREERLLTLLQSPQPGALAQAAALARESARFNLGRVARTINVPDIGIEYLLPKHAGRMRFDAPRSDTIDDAAVTMVRFREVRGPSIVRSLDGGDLLGEGRVWAEPASGEIVRTELILRDRNSNGRNVVDFRVEPRLSIRVPVKMTERYEMRGELVEAVATYSNVRSFVVATTEKLTKPPQ